MKQENGGEREIRTLETLSSLHAFQACAFNHSAISPLEENLRNSSSYHYNRDLPITKMLPIGRAGAASPKPVALKTP